MATIPLPPPPLPELELEQVIPINVNNDKNNNKHNRKGSTSANYDDDKRCWICYVSDQEQPTKKWSHPCKCKSSLKWVHETCLLAWIQEKSGTRVTNKSIVCSACGHPYNIHQMDNIILSIISLIDKVYGDLIPSLSLVGLGAATLIAFSSYGAFVVYLFCGPVQSQRVLSDGWSWKTLFGLPMIPVTLILSRFSIVEPILPIVPYLLIQNQEDIKMRLPPSPALVLCLLPWTQIVYDNIYKGIKSWIFRKDEAPTIPVIPSEEEGDGGAGEEEEDNILINADGDILGGREHRNSPRMVVGALLFPVVASVCGGILCRSALFRKYVTDRFHQRILGGGLFIMVKDAADLLYRYLCFRQAKSRRVIDYPEEQQ